jgi:hypothetical protein
MLSIRSLPIAIITCTFALAEASSSAMAFPAAPDAASKTAVFSFDSSPIQTVRFGGGRGGGGFRGGGGRGGMHAGRGFHGGRGSVAHRGYGFRGGGMRYGGRYGGGGRYAGRWGGRYGYGRYGYGRGAAAVGLGAAAVTAPYWNSGYGYNCGPYQYYQPGYGCVNQ